MPKTSVSEDTGQACIVLKHYRQTQVARLLPGVGGVPWHAVGVAVAYCGGRIGISWRSPWHDVSVTIALCQCDVGFAKVPRMACHGMPLGAMPCRVVPWGCRGMIWMAPWLPPWDNAARKGSVDP